VSFKKVLVLRKYDSQKKFWKIILKKYLVAN